MTDRTFTTGSRRDSRKGKGRHDLISPIVIRLLARHMESGSNKYGDRNWEVGQPFSWYLDSYDRHMAKHREGLRDEDHLLAAFWNLHGWLHTREMIARGLLPKELDDLPTYVTDPTVDVLRQRHEDPAEGPDRVPQGSRARQRARAVGRAAVRGRGGRRPRRQG